jgi:hypothetical protein
MRDQITTHERACNELGNLLVEHGLADRVKNNPDGITACIDLYGDQVVELGAVIEAGLLARSVGKHPSNGTLINAGTVHDPGTSNGVA